ncbi:hypothetical protein RBB79_18590 [Tunturiibacter empetritectus]|uniref:Uncharacterized protein n=1 Tax=Tunturiibacter lichenicola TaxID=2051959 RepID=A0A852VKI0_9BACT|nr:hypothetical protein [Edaphobacter lichenicola]NYF91671.1 hypothetical protein [Edaphobacter lichenicola]
MGKPYIKGGTPIGSDSLYKTCSYAHIMTGYRESEMVTMCNEVQPNIIVPFLIYDCTGFYDKNKPSWKQMEDLAIDLATGPMKPAGFKVGAGFHEAVVARICDDEDDE